MKKLDEKLVGLNAILEEAQTLLKKQSRSDEDFQQHLSTYATLRGYRITLREEYPRHKKEFKLKEWHICRTARTKKEDFKKKYGDTTAKTLDHIAHKIAQDEIGDYESTKALLDITNALLWDLRERKIEYFTLRKDAKSDQRDTEDE